MRSFNPSPLRAEEVTQFRFFNHLFKRNKCSGNAGYESLQRSTALVPSSSIYSGLQEHFLFVSGGEK